MYDSVKRVLSQHTQTYTHARARAPDCETFHGRDTWRFRENSFFFKSFPGVGASAFFSIRKSACAFIFQRASNFVQLPVTCERAHAIFSVEIVRNCAKINIVRVKTQSVKLYNLNLFIVGDKRLTRLCVCVCV